MEPGTINLGEEDLEENGSRNKITSIVAFQKGSMRKKPGNQFQSMSQVSQIHHSLLPTGRNKQKDSIEESCDANIDSFDIDSDTPSTNRDQAIQINRNIFELSLKLNELYEVPISKLKSNQQLKILDLSRNKIQVLPL